MSGRRLEHGTPEGYARGCTKDRDCPAFAVHGMSCQTAHIRFETGERRYMTLYAKGRTSTQIAQALGFSPPSTSDVAELEQEAELDRLFAGKPSHFRYRARRNLAETPAAPDPIRHPTPKEPAMPLPMPPKNRLTVEPAIIPDAAQPLAERAHDTAPEEDAGAPAIEEETRAPEPTVKAEAMGHHEHITTDRWTEGLTVAAKTARLKQIRAWCRAHGFPDVPTMGKIPQAALAAYAAVHPPVAADTPASADASRPDAPITPIRKPMSSTEHDEAMAGARQRAELQELNDEADGEPDLPDDFAEEGPAVPEVDLDKMLALAYAAIGTRMAAASVDADGTARVELIERVAGEIPWWNHTRDMEMTDAAVAEIYDDLVVAHLPDLAVTPARADVTRDQVSGGQPEWSEVEESLEELRQSREIARDFGARLEQELAHASEQLATAHTALEIALRKWAAAEAHVSGAHVLLSVQSSRLVIQAGTISLLQELYDTAETENVYLRANLDAWQLGDELVQATKTRRWFRRGR